MLAFAASIGITAAASAAPPPPDFTQRKLEIGGAERSYYIHAPKAVTENGAPVLLMLHGHGGSAADLLGLGNSNAAPYRQWLSIAKRERIVLIAPEGANGSDQKQGWNDCRADATTNPETDDVAFLNALLDAAEREIAIDRRRIYVVGTSNGGHMALRMAIEQPQRVSAVAAIVAAMPARSECGAAQRTVPVLFMNGTEDPILPFNGGEVAGGGRGTVLSTDASVRIWRRVAGISAAPRRFDFPNVNTGDASRVELWRHRSESVPQIALYRIVGGGHVEPSQIERYRPFYTRRVGAQNGDIEMAEEVWRFFVAQERR